MSETDGHLVEQLNVVLLAALHDQSAECFQNLSSEGARERRNKLREAEVEFAGVQQEAWEVQTYFRNNGDEVFLVAATCDLLYQYLGGVG